MIAIKGARPDRPLVVAANRDEFYAREATGPRVLAEGPRAVAGLDRESGGTWMGANAAGLFAALTNQRDWHGPDRSLRSRGEIVTAALACETVADVERTLAAVDGRELNSFNLMFGDARALRVAYGRRERREVTVEPLGDGLWVLPNDRIGSPDFPKARRARALVEPHAGAPWPELEASLRRALADHDRPPEASLPTPPADSRFTAALVRELQALCIHTPAYGTRSSTILALSERGVERYLYAEGPPCTHPFHDVTSLLSPPSAPSA